MILCKKITMRKNNYFKIEKINLRITLTNMKMTTLIQCIWQNKNNENNQFLF